MTHLNADIIIGIDPGTNTGLAAWSRKEKQFFAIETVKIHIALSKILAWHQQYNVFIRIEDARQRTWFGKTGPERLKGAGSVERDCSIWEDFLNENKIAFDLVHPKNNKTKLTAEAFRKITRYSGKTNEHNRDAAMLVFGF